MSLSPLTALNSMWRPPTALASGGHTAGSSYLRISNPVVRYAAYLALLSGVNGCQSYRGQQEPEMAGRELGELAPPSPEEPIEPCCQRSVVVGNMKGYLVDAETNEALGKGEVWLSLDDGRSFQFSTDKTGAFKLEELPAGNMAVSVQAPGYKRDTFEFYFKGGNRNYDFPLHKTSECGCRREDDRN